MLRSSAHETKLDVAHASLAHKDPTDRATQPRVFRANLPPDHPANRLEFDFAAANKLVTRRLGKVTTLASLGVLFYDLEINGPFCINGEPVNSTSAVVFEPISQKEGEPYYSPFIVLNVPTEIDLPDINDAARHELCHLGDRPGTPLYYRRGVVQGFKALSSLAITGGAAASFVGATAGLALYAKAGYNSPELQQLSLNGLPYLHIGMVARRNMHSILHAASPIEPRANRFAKNNADIDPVYLRE